MWSYAIQDFSWRWLKKYNPSIVKEIQNSLFKSMNKTDDPNANSSWVWAVGEDYVESLVSAVSAKSLLYQESLNKFAKWT